MIDSRPAPPPRVSVIIPTYNRANLLQEAVDSVLRQSYPEIEILVCDDGSTDDTPARFATPKGPIRYIRLPHSGSLGRTRNAGIEQARGEFVAFLDDDDRWEPHKLALQIAALDADSTAGVAYTDARLLFPDGSLSAPLLSADEKRPGKLFLRLLRNCFFHPSTVVVRRDLLVMAGMFDESLYTGEDLDLWLRLARLTREVCAAEPLVTIRRQPSSHSGRSGVQAYENAILAVDRQRRITSLTLRERLACRAAIARLHTRASVLALEASDAAAASEHSLRALRMNPLQRRAWAALRAARATPLGG